MLPIARTTREAVAAVADAVAGADMLVTTGGASVGDHDLVIEGLQSRGMVVDFWQIAMRPGKPLLFGRLAPEDGACRCWACRAIRSRPWSAAILFLLPALARLLGLPGRTAAGHRPALLGKAVGANDHRADHLRATRRHRRRRAAAGHPVPGAGLGDAAPAGAGRRADPARRRTPLPCRRAPRCR